ncbi:DEAD/DEAH box helicase family protein [Nocardioides marmoraquaticus]
MLPPVPSYADARCPHPLRRHQQQALDAVLAAREAGSTRWWVTLPPGAGKTLVGTEVARLLGRRTVVLSPNTAIQQQWARTWDAYDGPPAGQRRDLREGLTSLTYQALAVFDEADAEAGDGEPEGAGPGSQLERLHPHGRALVDTMREAGPLLLVLDECHHLLEVWGELVREVLGELPDAVVLGLTATPPASLSRAQAELVDDLFGPVLHEARIPALVKDGVLAPYAELAWVVPPTAEETAWLDEQSTRFAELVADLFRPDFGSVPLPQWLRERFVDPIGETTTWQALAAREPALTDALLRLAHAGLVDLPPGAVPQERHREQPTAEDWRLLVDDWLRGCVQPRAEDESRPAEETEVDRRVLRAVARALPAIGYAWTSRGVRTGRGVVDRVTARSRAKEQAVTSIVDAELADLGDRARVLVLCDHERATATSSARVADDDGVAPEPAGSATGVLVTLLADPVAAGLDPVLVTGRTVAGGRATLERFLEWLGETHPMLAGTMRLETDGEVPRLEGSWTSGQWVGHLTRWFTEGGTQCLVGTRGLLGEGWDAPAVTTLIDLTTVTTPTAVVQTRGRALRLDPAHPEKVAQVWSVVCVHHGHAAGANDWRRFTRKHAGYLAVDEHGTVVDGVAGVDSAFSEHHPPPADELDAVAARMLRRASQRDAVREAWLASPAYTDQVTHVLRVRRSAPAPGAPAPAGPQPTSVPWSEQRRRRPGARLVAVPPVVALVLVGALALLGAPLGLVVAAAVVLLALAAAAGLALWGRAALRGAAEHQVTLQLVACAVADGLRAAGLSPVGADGVRAEVAPDGRETYRLDGVPEDVSARFAEALAEVVSPMASPRYVVARWVTAPPAGLDGLERGWRDRGRQQPDGEVWHTVPSLLATHRSSADAFATAWGHWVGGGPATYAHTPVGAGVLATHRGQDPFAVTCVVRREWG